MVNRRKYDSTIPWMFSQNKEHLLDSEFRKSIPKSTQSDWKNGFENYYGHEYRNMLNDALEYHILLLEHQKLKKILNGISKVWISLSKIVHPILHKDKDFSQTLVNHTQMLFQYFPKKIALKIMGFNPQLFHYRITNLIACSASSIKQCIKQNSRQLTSFETNAIKDLFENKVYACWPVISLYYQGLRENLFKMGRSTFAKYAKLMGYHRKIRHKVERKIGLITTAPNQYLHIDTTFYHHLDSGQKVPIVFASDNFSRCILGHTIADKHGSVNVADTIKQTVKTIHKYHPNHTCNVKLVADGGSENHAITITELLNATDSPSITKIIAKKDIQFSNSPIEAINKICKRFLRHYKPKTMEQLIEVINSFVIEYNTKRPHGTLKGLTPIEAYQNFSTLNFSEAIAQARINRILTNKAIPKCKLC
jgi:transposase InsO family protein